MLMSALPEDIMHFLLVKVTGSTKKVIQGGLSGGIMKLVKPSPFTPNQCLLTDNVLLTS